MPDISDSRRGRRRRLAYVLGPAVLAGGLAVTGVTQVATSGTANAAVSKDAAPASAYPPGGPIWWAPGWPGPTPPPLGGGPSNCEFNGSLQTTIITVSGISGGTEHTKVGRSGCPGMYLTDAPSAYTYQGYYLNTAGTQWLPCLGHYVKFSPGVSICNNVTPGSRMRVRTQPDSNTWVGVQM
jgi:hypothetical protein